jgi:hypothetical protein
LKITFTTEGDPSAGIVGERVEVEWYGLDLYAIDDREMLIEELTDFFQGVMDGDIEVEVEK